MGAIPGRQPIDVLRTLPTNRFNFICVNGFHENHHILEDLVLSANLLKVGGVMIAGCYTRE